ncbi:MAG: Crp/Fnr family transcriptional regulator [Anaerolineales bacterium]|jgi:CRP/FNR family cyclic AMP-dependent transcriptional regulator
MDAELLDRFAFIEGFSQEQVAILDPMISDVRYDTDQVIFSQGEVADYLYFVIDGRVSIRFKPEDGPVLSVADVKQGEVFGWSSALGSKCYTSSAVCAEGGLFVRITGKDLKRLCQEHPETGILILNRLAGVIAQRLRGTHEQVVALLHHGLNQTEPGGCYERGPERSSI